MFKRGSGILLHISSLPSKYGIGDLGPAAYDFVDFLARTKQKYWQLLPLNPTDSVYGNSPYSSVSAFAFNVLFISPEKLVSDGWLENNDIVSCPESKLEEVDYISVTKSKHELFDKAYQRFCSTKDRFSVYEEFCKSNESWLSDYVLFVCLKEKFEGKEWNKWPHEARDRNSEYLEQLKNENKDRLERLKFLQFLFCEQWKSLKSYCNQKGVLLIGDIPIYVNYDSVDAWANPEIYKFDENKNPVSVAGVPPDYFSETGQRWGNPVYDWKKLKDDNYSWWIDRIRHNLEVFDCFRIDHFRGFVACWEIPVDEQTAINGKWVKGCADDFFENLRKVFPDIPLIAEDLGIITPDVVEVMEKFSFPGMKVLMFAFGEDIEKHPYIPKNYKPNCVVYTGTHDNNTVVGWLANDISDIEKENVSKYLDKDIDPKSLPWDLIEIALKSVANIAIIPLQDLLGLGEETRMNKPATTQDNWLWRFSRELLNETIEVKLSYLTKATKRS